MLAINDIGVRYGERWVLRDVRATIEPGDRVGLVGANGAGKSTLLKLLAGLGEADTGSIERAQQETVGYLPQEGLRHDAATVRKAVEEAAVAINKLFARQHELQEALHSHPTESEAYRRVLHDLGEVEHALEAAEAHKLATRVEILLAGLGFRERDFDRPPREFSGGWQMRIALARLLLQAPTFLLLDEPTNHLDLPSLRWLEGYLQTYPGAIILVSHDRTFLDRLTTRTFFVHRGDLEVYSGNYSWFVQEREARKEQREQAAKNQQRRRAQTERFIERFRYKNTKARQVQSRIKMLEREEVIETEEDDAGIRFRFPPPPRSGELIVELQGITKRYGELEVFRGLDLEINRGEKLAIVGVNGAGKSTLVRILAGIEPIQAGHRKLGHNVAMALFAQHQAETLPAESTVLEVVRAAAHEAIRPHARDLLGAFLFTDDDVNKRIGVLSGGEKSRVALAKMLVQPANCVILDEPTNHLDMQSKEVLQEALRNYAGTVLLVSHDRDFLEPVIGKVLDVRPGGKVITYPGTLHEYLDRTEEAEGDIAKTRPDARGTTSKPGYTALNPKERRRREAQLREKLAPLRKEAEALEAEIGGLEARIAKDEEAMLDPDFFAQGATTTERLQAYEAAKERLIKAMTEWEERTAAIEAEEAAARAALEA